MNPNQLVQEAKEKLTVAVNHFNDELKKLRTGRAHPGMLEGITVSVYGQASPLAHVATVTTPEAQLIQISPYDPSNLQAIVSAIRDDQSLGMNPTDDGRVVRVPVPPLTTERRQQIVKLLHDKVEECMIATRQVRQEIFKQGDQAKKDKLFSEDDHKRFEKQIDELMSNTKSEVDKLANIKEQEILKV